MANFQFGDIAIDAAADVTIQNANVNVGSLLSIATTFNPYSFAASTAVDVISKLFSASRDRKFYEQQIALLQEIKGMLVELNAKADLILQKLDALPVVLQRIVRDEVLYGRLDDHHVHFDSVALQYSTLPNFRIQSDQ
jgi:hypothetical protein